MRIEKNEAGPNRIPTVIDTTRKDTLFDNMSSLPNLKRILADSVKYNDVISSASWTVHAHSTMFSELDPSEHRFQARIDLGAQVERFKRHVEEFSVSAG